MRIPILYIVLINCLAHGQDRKITSKLNPNCDDCTDETILVYIRADGSNDTIHQIWDFSRGVPTMIFVTGSLDSRLNVVWDNTKPLRFEMPEKPKYSFAAAIDKLIEYNDTDDVGHFDFKFPQRSYPLSGVSWRRDDIVLTDKEVMVQLHTRYFRSDEQKSGTIGIKLDLLPFKDYSVDLPHLIHTANSTLVDINLVNLTSSWAFNQSRFAIHFVLASTDNSDDNMHNIMRKSLDDEHTPGVFEIIEIKSPLSLSRAEGGYLQFRPVGYTQPERGVTTSTNAHVSPFNRTTVARSSTLSAYFNSYVHEDLLVQDMVISFGEPGDGFYKQHNYTAWSYTIGYGAPPIESFSLFVILIICIGLGIPVVLALSGVAYVVVRRYRQRNAPTRFIDDE